MSIQNPQKTNEIIIIILIIVLEVPVVITGKRQATNERKGENNIKYFARFLIKFHSVVF